MTPETLLRLLAEWSVRATALALATGLLLWLLRVKDVSMRLGAWTLVLCGALLIPIISFLAPAIPMPLPGLHVQYDALAPLSFPESVQRSRPTMLPSITKASVSWPAAISAIWVSVSVAMLSSFLMGLFLTRRLVRASKEISPGVYESNCVSVPLTVGVARPVILLPADWREWGAARLQAILAHERAHVRRHDTVVQAMACVYRGLCWFHPLAWWLCWRLRGLAEAASDDAALAATQDEVLYAEALLGFAGRAPARVQWEGLAMVRRAGVTKRMERILDAHRKLAGPLPLGLAVALAIAALGLTYVAASAQPMPATVQVPLMPPIGQVPSSPTPRSGNLRSPYSKWLDEDVAYIITEQEEAAFERLTTDEEREAFIQQFWFRRDPTPGTAENEYKVEHYRRIAYANDHFAGEVPGWRTDRGRVYIVFGPPDEKEDHSEGDAGHPSEFWRYRYLEALGSDVSFKFVDLSGDGQFTFTHLAVGGTTAGLVSVESGPDRLTQITIPLGPEAAPVSIHGHITKREPRFAYQFEDKVSAPVFRKTITLAPGWYRLQLDVKDADDRQTIRHEELAFEVK